MANYSREKKRVYSRDYYAEHKDDPEWMEKRRAYGRAYDATHKEVRGAYRDTHKEETAAYREKNKEQIKKQRQEYYQENREEIIQRTSKYHQENKEERQKWFKQYYQKIRLEVLDRVDPAMKCAMCGCDDTRFLEVNHIKGGGMKEHRKRGDGNRNMILLIHNGKRGLEYLNLLCRACNSLDHLERVYGHTGLRVVWDKQVTK